MIEDLNNSIKSKDEEIQKVIKEKADMELLNQLFTESSNEQIENLSKENKEFKEKNEKLNEENKSIKEELEQKKTELENRREEINLNYKLKEKIEDNRHNENLRVIDIKEKHLENILFILIPLGIFHLVISGKTVKDEQP